MEIERRSAGARQRCRGLARDGARFPDAGHHHAPPAAEDPLHAAREGLVELEPGDGTVEVEGEGAAELPRDARHLALRAFALVAPTQGHSFRFVNRIPLERGLGSSSAAIVGGVALAHVLLGLLDEPDPATTFAIAAGIEGHPDNVAAAAFGGFTIVTDGAHVSRFDPHPGVRPVVLIPERARISTGEARRRLEGTVALEDAVYNAGHAALTAAALLGRPQVLHRALGDRLHERARLALAPDVAVAFERLRSLGVPVCVSGSGPSLLAFERDDLEVPDPGEGWRLLRVGVRRAGVEIVRG
jgi:homoserine kinase